MATKTVRQYLKSIDNLSPRAYLGGKKIDNLLENPTAKSIIDATAKVFELARDRQHAGIMTTRSHLTSEVISRATHINHSVDDLEKRLEMALLISQQTGTCNYRCGAASALNGLASITWEMDQKLGTDYNKRFNEYLRYVQDNDLVLSVGSTNPKGDRTKRPQEQDPDMYLRIVERKRGGIVIRGAKLDQTGAATAQEHIISGGAVFSKGEEDCALAVAIPNGEKGVTYICQHNPYTVERENADDISVIGNPRYGQREMAIVVFDDVFVPWERVFMCGEVEFTARLRTRQSQIHGMCEGACKAGFLDLMIGAAQLSAEYSGLEKVPHIQMNIANMIKAREICYGMSVAAAARGKEDPIGSGVYFPDRTFASLAVVYSKYGFWEAMQMAIDVAGGLVVTMPSEKDLRNPETRDYVERYLKAVAPANKRLRVTKFLQNWVCGLHGAATWQGGGAPFAVLMGVHDATDLEQKKRLVEKLAGIE